MSTLEKERVFSEKGSLKLELIPVFGYEKVFKVTDPSVGLTAIIAIHSTSLGVALGGTRILPYNSFEEALKDALLLSKGMTAKSAVAEVGFGGGKSVILADPNAENKEELLLSFGEAVESLGGLYTCAEDMGCTTKDVEVIRRKTRYVVGLVKDKSSGDPGLFTARGVFKGIQSAMQKLYKSDSLEGKKIAVQGLGNVGSNLLEHLFWAGAHIIVSDVDEEKGKALAKKYGATFLSPSEILEVECDVFSPCARGGIINDRTITRFRCKAIVGGANNQLEKEEHADLLQLRGILYAPDFVVNAGGLFNVAAELEEEGYHPKRPRDKVEKIYENLLGIYEIAEKNHMSTQSAAAALAEYRIRYGIGKRTKQPSFPAL